ncbi:hemerythrin domain-containing protein [uncultured Thiohalocapsa sp.]|uniref:hemerythrin domain-containing protein n=1 Tax=uncultured Thiohalocapsa sp. TaxID=768990 RepID=UPI0025D0E7E5|nr:hemerythrin domain-containing protein [uncultured Thiohalocapsa sp.]
MRRDPNLRRLSRDHHTGLVLAKRIRELSAADAARRDAAWTEAQARFADALEPHFQLEEQGLLPALRAAGEDALVERTLAEHAELRRLIRGPAATVAERFAEALTAHIRFEEATLFETAQRVLDPDLLAQLGALH